jgi:hypothetical protein
MNETGVSLQFNGSNMHFESRVGIMDL